MADWTEQAEQMLKTWTEAQKNVWDSWQDLAGRASGAPSKPQAFSMNPMEWFQQSMSTWTDKTGVARDAGRQVFGSQFSMMQNLDMLTKAWKMIAPFLDAGQDWRSPLAGFTTNWFEQLTGVPNGLSDTTKDTGALLQSYMSEWGPLLRPWISSAVEATGTGHLGEMMLGGSAGLARLLSMEQDEFQKAPFTGLAEIPSIGVNREHQAKILRAFDAFVDMRKVMLEFNKMAIGALNKSVETVMETLVEKSKKGETIQSVRDLNRLWLDSADKVFTEMYVSEEYLKAQRELSSAGMTYKIMQQDVIEMVLKNLNLPTRSELDDAYKTLYELRKEVKSLKKEIRAQSKPAVEAKEVTRNAIKQVATKKVTKPAAVKKSSPRKKATARARSAERV
jgi:class III poly(R)-hydroxyalkanoic acid synthase PhaE subunit